MLNYRINLYLMIFVTDVYLKNKIILFKNVTINHENQQKSTFL